MRLVYNNVLQAGTVSASTELSLTLRPTTLVIINTTNVWDLYGVSMIGGNLDGTVITIVSGPTGHGFSIADRNVLASSPANRFSNPSSATFLTSANGSVTYIYDSAALLWMNLGRTR